MLITDFETETIEAIFHEQKSNPNYQSTKIDLEKKTFAGMTPLCLSLQVKDKQIASFLLG